MADNVQDGGELGYTNDDITSDLGGVLTEENTSVTPRMGSQRHASRSFKQCGDGSHASGGATAQGFEDS